MDCCMGFAKSNYLTAVMLSLVCFKAFTLVAGLSLPPLNKQYKQISKNWFITMWEYKSVTGLFIYAIHIIKILVTQERKKSVNISNQLCIVVRYADSCCFFSFIISTRPYEKHELLGGG